MKYRRELLVFLFYFLLTAAFTYPLFFKMGTSVYGYPGDNFSTIWYLWWNKYALTHSLPIGHTPFLNAPLGKDLGVGVNSAVLYAWSMTGLSFLVGEVAAFNIINFLSFPLAALTMLVLVKHLTKNSWAAVLSGLIFSFSPYHFWKSYNHADLASIQWLPLYVYCLVRLFEERKYRWSFLTALSFVVVTLTSFYYGYFMILFTVGFVLLHLMYDRLVDKVKYFDLKMLKPLLLTGILTAVFIFPFTYKLFLAASSSVAVEAVPGRAVGLLRTTTDELLALSSRPWDFILPSEHHPILGKYTSAFCGWLAKNSGGFETQCTHYPQERNIYLGWAGIGLSLFALKNHKRNRWILIFAILAILMIWVSFPAFINVNGRRFYFPSYFLHNFTPMFRSYVRLGVVVLLCTAILAGFGLSFILEKIKDQKLLAISYTLFAILILFDFTNIPPLHYTDLSETPPVYQWLKERPGDFIIAEYPQPYSEAEAMFFQRIHQKRMITVTEELSTIYQPEIVEKLKGLGVKYAVVHIENTFPSDPYNTNRVYQVMSPPMETVGLKIVRQFDEALVYEVL